MVKLLFNCMLLSHLAFGETFRLEAIPSAQEIYQGEQVTMNYSVVGEADTVDAEVAKFPEFRGYWSENLLLRQGPISLVSENLIKTPGFSLFQELTLSDLKKRFSQRVPTGPKRGMIGTYILTPMVGKEDLKIEPMKVVVKNLNDPNATALTLEDKEIPLKIKRLPPPPSDLAHSFTGAVGRFSLNWERAEIPFRSGEPVLVRLNLNGQGNFYEMNSVPLELPPGVEVLSQKSTLHGSGQFATKMFDTVLTFNGTTQTTTPVGNFVYFDPARKQYAAIQIPQLTFVPVPALVADENDELLGLLPREQIRTLSSFQFPIWFWALQIGLFLFLMFDLLKYKTQQSVLRKSSATSALLRLRLHVAENLLKSGDVETAEETLYALAEGILNSQARSDSAPLSRSKRLALIEGSYGPDVRVQLENFLLAFDQSRYHPSHLAMQPTEIYLKSLKSCVLKVA